MVKIKQIKNLIKINRVKKNIFFLATLYCMTGFLGWVLETVFFAVALNCWCDRGFIVLPMVPVYGIAAALIYLILGTPHIRFFKKIQTKIKPKFLGYIVTYLLYYLLATAIATIAEFFGGLLLDKVFHVALWSYKTYPHNFMGYVCLQYSLQWGLIITAYMPFVRYFIQNLCDAYGYKTVAALSIAFAVFSILDFAVCGLYAAKTGKQLELFVFKAHAYLLG